MAGKAGGHTVGSVDRRSRGLLLVASIGVALTAGGCSMGSPMALSSDQAQTATEIPPAAARAAALARPLPGKAQLVITRARAAAHSGAPATVTVNGTKVAELQPGGTSSLPLLAGPSLVTVSSWTYPGEHSLEIEPQSGEIITLEVAPREESLGASMLFGSTASGATPSSVFKLRVVSLTKTR